MVTLFDVARLAGVSTATVSRVLHGHERVREATRARVEEAIEELGYVPDSAAQSLSLRRKDVIGLVCIERPTCGSDVEDSSMLYYDKILRGVEAKIRELDLSLLVMFYAESGTPDISRINALSGKVDGMLLGEDIFPPDLIQRLAGRIPFVVIAGSPAGHAVDIVTADNRSGSAALARHLVEVHGCRRLYVVNGPANSHDSRQRRIGVEQVVQASPGCQVIGCYQGNYSVQSGVAAGEHLLATSRDALPDAIVAMNDQMAMGVLHALTEAGVRVPGELAVTGFDDISPASRTSPPLTTVNQPIRLLGERACTRLLDRIAAPGLAHRVELLPTELVVRSSCGCPLGTAIRLPAAEVRLSQHRMPIPR